MSAAEKDRGRLDLVSSVMSQWAGTSTPSTYTYQKRVAYDVYGNPVTVTETLPGTTYPSIPTTAYVFNYGYDAWGRLSTKVYPNLRSQLAIVKVSYEYDGSLGHLKALKDPDTGWEHWSLLSADADGQTKSEKLGGIVTTHRAYNTMRRPYTTVSSSTIGGTLQSMEYAFDSLGNLTSRKDWVQSSQESFSYDVLNRLKTTTTQYRVGTQNLSVSKSNDYDGHGNLINKEGITITYGSDGLAPNRIHQISEAKNTGVGRLSFYDKNGNATHIGDNRNVIWNSFNKAERITRFSELSTLYYNADHQRILQQATKGHLWYAGEGALERSWNRADSRETYKYQLTVGDQSIGYIHQTYDTHGTSSNQRLYTLTDHLGSVQALVRADGRKLESLSFSAWGERRAADWNPSGVATPALDLARNWGLTQGFTGHEADEPWGLINMKGRLYDPIVGRFLSADPFIQFTTNTQSYNRYTYVLNNPLSFTDPTGYNVLDDAFGFIAKNIRTIIAIGFGIVTGGLAAGFYGGVGTLAGAVAGGAVGAFTTTLIASGSIEAALRAGIFGALSAGLASSIGNGVLGHYASYLGKAGAYLAHGVAQGVVSILQGGKFGSGFASGFFGHLARGVRAFGAPGTGSFGAMMGRTMVAAMVGGTVSQMTGGKFANGAMTAAFVHLFNAEASAGTWGAAPKPIDWGAVGSFAKPLLSVLSRLLGAVGLAATPSTLGDSSQVTSYKAPRLDQVADILSNGFTNAQFPGNGAYFTISPDVVRQYAYQYGAGVFVVNTPMQVFNDLSSQGLITVDPYEVASFSVSPLGLPVFSEMSTIEYLPPNSLELYDKLGLY